MFWNKSKKDRELIEYAEQEAKILAAFQIDCADVMERSATTLLNILLGGAGGGLALAISLYEKGAESWIVVGTFATSIYLFVLCGILAWRCLWTRDIYSPANQPCHLYSDNTKHLTITELKYYELENRQIAIDKNRERNNDVGLWLNRVRAFSALTPLIIILAFLFF